MTTPPRRVQDAPADTIMKWVANAIVSIGAVVLLITGVYLAILDKSASTTIGVLGFGFLFAVLLLLAKFKRFKGFGFEAEMWEEKQEEAAALIAVLEQEFTKFREPRASLLKGKTAEITEKLSPFAGTQFDCGFARNSGEQAAFWWVLQPALTDAGWENLPWRYGETTGGYSQGGRPETGEVAATNVEIHIHEEQRTKLALAAAALISTLNDVDVEARDMGFNAHNTNTTAIHILIGQKQ